MRWLVCLALLLGTAHAEPQDAGDPIEKAAAHSSLTTDCVCINGPLAEEIAKLRREITILRMSREVNVGIECAKKRRGKR